MQLGISSCCQPLDRAESCRAREPKCPCRLRKKNKAFALADFFDRFNETAASTTLEEIASRARLPITIHR